MLVLDPTKRIKTSFPITTVWLLVGCMEAKGQQDLWLRQKPEVLAGMKKTGRARVIGRGRGARWELVR